MICVLYVYASQPANIREGLVDGLECYIASNVNDHGLACGIESVEAGQGALRVELRLAQTYYGAILECNVGARLDYGAHIGQEVLHGQAVDAYGLHGTGELCGELKMICVLYVYASQPANIREGLGDGLECYIASN